MISKLPGQFLTFEVPNGGLTIWAACRQGISAKAVLANAAKLGLKTSGGSNYFFQSKSSRPN